jgi:GNAT superfamily N-acetyltransferase
VIEELDWMMTIDLRQRVLGWGPAPVPGDEDSRTVHLGWRDDCGDLVGVVSWVPHRCPERPMEHAAYLWAMAVEKDHQGQGVGSALIRELLHRTRSTGCVVLWADARASAVGFYTTCGAKAAGPEYTDAITGLADRRIVFSVN